MRISLTKLTQAAAIGAIYAALTLVFAPISFGALQIRVSEALSVMPLFTGAAVPGLFVGCLVANILGGLGIVDIVFGSLATLVAALLTYLLRRKWALALLPPVLVNALVVGIYLKYVYFPEIPLYVTIGQVGAGQAASVYIAGFALYKILKKYKARLFG